MSLLHMCVCVDVCVYVCMYARMYVYKCSTPSLPGFLYIKHRVMYVCMHVCMYINVAHLAHSDFCTSSTDLCTYVCIYARMYVYKCSTPSRLRCLYIKHRVMYVCMYICTYVCI